MHPLLPSLRTGLEALGLALSTEQQNQLLAYLELIEKWNQVYNLTAVRKTEAMLNHHLLDSLAVIGPLRREANKLLRDADAGDTPLNLLDVGSGAGLPGVVIAIACPDIAVTCVDAVAKKAAFIQQTALTLGLTNLKGVHARVESLSQPFDVVCSRAFASLHDFANGSRCALANHGVWMAMKGKHPQQELDALPEDVKAFHVEQLLVPALNAERCIVWMRG